MEDSYFVRIWRAAQLKRAGVPVLELITTLDDALAIHAVDNRAEQVTYDKQKAAAENGREDPEDL